MNNFVITPTYCNVIPTYALSVIGYGSPPSFINSYSLSGSSKTITVYTSQKSDAKSYNLIVTATVVNSPSSTVSSTLTIPLVISTQNTGPPYFESALKDVSLKVGETSKITLSGLKDDDNDDYIIESVSLGTASSFIKGSFPSYTINPTIASNVGRFPVNIKVKDDNTNPLSAIYTFYVTVEAKPSTSSTATTSSTSATAGSASATASSTTAATSSTSDSSSDSSD